MRAAPSFVLLCATLWSCAGASAGDRPDAGSEPERDVGSADGSSNTDDGGGSDAGTDDSTLLDATELEDGMEHDADAADAAADAANDTAPPDVSPTDVAELADAGDAAPDDAVEAGDVAPADPTLDSVLAELRTDRDTTLRRYANEGTGWPLRVSDGVLFVTTDTSLDRIAGSFTGWTPVAVTRDEGFSWYLGTPVPGNRYKFTTADGSRWVADPWSRGYAFDENGEISVFEPTGRHLERFFGVTDGVVTARNLQVLVPAEPITHVVYAHDGQNLYGIPTAILGGWKLEESAPPGMLVVGIENTPARYEDYGPSQDLREGVLRGGGAAHYAEFIRSTVRPMVRRLWGEPGPVAVMGSSMGGVISLYIALVQPGEWDMAISLSGALDWGSRNLTNPTIVDLYRDAGHGSTPIYLDSGGTGGTCQDTDGDGLRDDDPTEADSFCVNNQMRDLLADNGYTFDVDLWHWWEPNALHNEPAWAARVWRPLGHFAAMR